MNIFNKTAIILTSVLMTGCFSLDQQPYEDVGLDKSFSNITDAKTWTNGMYYDLRNNAYGVNMYVSDIQSDLLNATTLTRDSDVLFFHTWEKLVASNSTLQTIWIRNYKTISNINIALEGFEKIPVRDAEQQTQLNYYTGELLLGRAFCYTYLATSFCKPYKEATAATDLGLYMPLKYDVTAAANRLSLKASYEAILADITRAEQLLDGKVDNTKTTFTHDAARALKARVLLYMEKWEDAYNVATDLLNDVQANYPLSNYTKFTEMWHKDDATESITQLFVQTSETEFLGINDIYSGGLFTNPNTGMPVKAPLYVPTKDIYDLFSGADYRYLVYFSQQAEDIYGGGTTFHSGIYTINKYPGNPALQAAGSWTSEYRHQPKLLRIAEVYLIAAEAGFHAGKDAITPLSALQSSRSWSRSPFEDLTSLSSDELLKEIQNERTREFVFEGMRLFDLKRWGKAITRGTPQNEDAIQTTPASQYHQLNRPANDPKSVWGIPSREVGIVNGQQNPGW